MKPWFVVTMDNLVNVYPSKSEALKDIRRGHDLKKVKAYRMIGGGYEISIPHDVKDRIDTYYICQEDDLKKHGFDWVLEAYKWALDSIKLYHRVDRTTKIAWAGECSKVPSLDYRNATGRFKFPAECEPVLGIFSDNNEAVKEKLRIAVEIAQVLIAES